MIKVNDPREALIRLVTFLGGIYFVLEFLLPESLLKEAGIAPHHEAITNGFLAAVYVSIGLGIINLLLVHGTKILFQRTGATYSIVLLAGLILMITVSAIDWINGLADAASIRRVEILSMYAKAIPEDVSSANNSVPHHQERIKAFIPHLERLSAEISDIQRDTESSEIKSFPNGQLLSAIDGMRQHPSTIESLNSLPDILVSAKSVLTLHTLEIRNKRLSRKLFSFLFDGVFSALGSSMFALLAFYIAAAAYRAFKIKTIESLLMMLAALFVILGQTSFGLMISESFAYIRLWLLEVPSAGVFRAIKLGAGIASLVLCLRMWFSVEGKISRGGVSDG